MKKVMKAGVISAIAFCASMANASVVSFEQDSYGPAASFVDGTFSSNLSGRYPDGFYSFAYFDSRTYALNGYGQNGEYILFNAPVQFNSVSLAPYTSYGTGSVSVSLYDSLNNFLTQQTADTSNGSENTLTFNTNNVSKVVFDFPGGSDVYNDGRNVAWYIVSNATYSANQANVPEPATVALFGFGLLGFAASRRKSKTK